ncbi:hypothetical protein LM602_00845, partial [Candidatus Acetothermia bacterium]|nr:hypothetical protein [Candidatus Acetothermia bacterium]MCI2435716.1 hypothetical protein [Candidatus Acetothermia bacterium]
MSQKENNQKQDFKHGAQVKMHKGEIDIDTLLVKQLLTEQFPHLANKSLTVVRSTGTVNAIYRLGDDLYVRLPRLEEWAESIDNEWTWLSKLAPHISLTIPKPIARGKPTNWYPCPWAIYHWIKGSLYQDDLIRDERQVAYDLVNFIKILCWIPPSLLGGGKQRFAAGESRRYNTRSELRQTRQARGLRPQ